MSKVKIIGFKEPKVDGVVINTTSHSKNWSKALSPFFLGPCKLYGSYTARRVENGWQYSKVYEEFTKDGEPTLEYFQWAVKGWHDDWAHRYPMGKGKKPLYNLWAGQKLGYIEARKKIFFQLYYKAAKKTEAYKRLREEYQNNDIIYLWDFDGYDYELLGMTLNDVVNNPDKTMGHAFILAMMLERGE